MLTQVVDSVPYTMEGDKVMLPINNLLYYFLFVLITTRTNQKEEYST